MKLIRFSPEDGGGGTAAGLADDTVIVDSELAHLAEMEKSLLGSSEGLENEIKSKLAPHMKVQSSDGQKKEAVKKEEADPGDTDESQIDDKKTEKKEKASDAITDEDGEEKGEKKETKRLPFQKKEAPATTSKGSKPLFENEETQKAVTDYLQSKFGKEIKDPRTFLEKSVISWREDSQKLQSVQENYERLAGAIDDLPEFMQKAMIAYRKDEDWQSVLNNGMNEGLDFKKPFEKQIESAAKRLMPEANLSDSTEEDFIDLKNTDSVKTKKFLQTLERLWTDQKSVFERNNLQKIDDNKKVIEKSTGIVKKSIKELGDSLPDDLEQREAQIKGVKQTIGNADFDSIFFDDDGIPHEDVATRVYFAKFGPELIALYLNEIERLNGELADLTVSGADKKAIKTSNKRTAAGQDNGNDLVDDYEKTMSGESKRRGSAYDPPIKG